MESYFTILFASILIGLIILYLRKILNDYNFFKNRGIPGPSYPFLFGNFFELHQDKKWFDVLAKWTTQYGKTYGYFEGHTPILVTSDVDFLQEVFIKQYSNFAARKVRAFDPPDNAVKVGIITATESRWKNMRQVMNPTFSSLKLRELNPIIAKCSQRFIEKVNKEYEKSGELNMTQILKRFTMDNIWNCAFGIDIDLQNSTKNEIYIQKTDEAILSFSKFTIVTYISIFFHEFRRYIVTIYLIVNLLLFKLSQNSNYVNPMFWLREMSMNMVDKRISDQDSQNKRDLLQLLLDSYTKNDNELQQLEKLDYESVKLKKKLSIDEIKLNLAVVILAGYDTTYTTLSNCILALARYPEEQDRLISEIQQYLPDKTDEPTVDVVKNFEYMECFISEVSRLNPIGVGALTRRCVHPTTINGIDIPVGLTIQADVTSIHHDIDLWGPVDTNLFDPSRFSKEHKRHPLAYLSFGGGPRNCIGAKFAIIVMKIALIKLLREYEIVSNEKTKQHLNYEDGFVRKNLEDAIVTIRKRNN